MKGCVVLLPCFCCLVVIVVVMCSDQSTSHSTCTSFIKMAIKFYEDNTAAAVGIKNESSRSSKKSQRLKRQCEVSNIHNDENNLMFKFTM